jgi:hypothetical protein
MVESPPAVWNSELDRLQFGQRLDGSRLPTPYDQRGRGVIVHHALDRVGDLVAERRLGHLREPADKESHFFDGIEAGDPVLRDDVHHTGRQTRIGNHAHALGFRGRIELLLFLDDLGVPAEIGKVDADVDGQSGESAVEVVGDGTGDGVAARKGGPDLLFVAHVERERHQSFVGDRLQKGGKARWIHIGEQHLLDRRCVQQIERARGALQPGAEYEHTHGRDSGWVGKWCQRR